MRERYVYGLRRGVSYGWIQAKVAVERGGVCVSGCDTHAYCGTYHQAEEGAIVLLLWIVTRDPCYSS